MDYQTYLGTKLALHTPCGIDPDLVDPSDLADFQLAMVRWGVQKGRCAFFSDTGLGKTRKQLKFANTIYKYTGSDAIILAPLAVAEQTVGEGKKIGIEVTHCRENDQVKPGINITNYERVHKFDTSRFNIVVLDESSIIKHQDSKTFQILCDAFQHTDYKLCASATPAPNAWPELGQQAEFLGICTKQEMLSEYFVHDGGKTQDWRLMGHAKENFWRWVASWGAMVRSPSDLDFDDSAYQLPPLNIEQVRVDSDATAKEGQLFALEGVTLQERRQARRDSLSYRVKACADLVNNSKEIWVVWCELNDEADALRDAIPDAIEIRGTDKIEQKELALRNFSRGNIRALITKPSIAGHGLNWQHCSHVAYVGITDSRESRYQSMRRFYRFGQTRPVNVFEFMSDQEEAVRRNIEKKERLALEMSQALSNETRQIMKDEVLGQKRQTNTYNPKQVLRLPMFFNDDLEIKQ